MINCLCCFLICKSLCIKALTKLLNANTDVDSMYFHCDIDMKCPAKFISASAWNFIHRAVSPIPLNFRFQIKICLHAIEVTMNLHPHSCI